MEENRIATIDESSDIFTETEDESDQAKASSKEGFFLVLFPFCWGGGQNSFISYHGNFILQHYKESNEKYYLIAHRYDRMSFAIR